jgi:hypothetical protein
LAKIDPQNRSSNFKQGVGKYDKGQRGLERGRGLRAWQRAKRGSLKQKLEELGRGAINFHLMMTSRQMAFGTSINPLVSMMNVAL